MSQSRAGRTIKVSVSLSAQDVVELKALARDSYEGNLSAAFAEAVRMLKQRAARQRLVRRLGGSVLDAAAAAAIDAEQAGGPRYRPRKRRGRAA